jgi:glycosyltransferase involved in cell wall biosynthesis
MSALSRLDSNVIPDSDEIRLFAKVRNEAERLPFFFSYYRTLGVDRFFIIDNGSTDGTLEYLRQLSDCHTFFTTDKMSNARAGIDWIQPLLNQFGQNRWCIVVDADELLVYPDSEIVPLPAFCRALDRVNADAFPCYMLDMYPDGNIDEIKYSPGQSFIEACPFFDATGYHRFARKGKGPVVGPVIMGGPRVRMFYPELLDRRLRTRIKRRILTYCGIILPKLKPPAPINLNKIPLVRWNGKMQFGPSAHDISYARLADGLGALLHFKFLGRFSDQVKEEFKRKAYLGGYDYEAYYKRVSHQQPIIFKCDSSLAFKGTRQLLELGLINEISPPNGQQRAIA